MPVQVVTTPESTAEIELPHAGGILDDFCESAFANYALFVTGSEFTMNGEFAGITGSVGIGNGVNQNVSEGGINGDYVVHPPGTGGTGIADTEPGPGGQPLSPVYQDLIDVRNSTLYLSAAVASLSPTQSFGNITSSQTISSTAPDGVNVVNIGTVSLSGWNYLTLTGGPDDYFILNIQNSMTYTGNAGMVLLGGIPWDHVIVNTLPGSTEVKLAGDVAGYFGTFLAVQDTNTVRLNGNAMLLGAVAAPLVQPLR